MSTKINELLEAIHKKEEKDIYSLEKEVAEDIEDSVECDLFFELPLENIFSIVSKIDFFEIENYSNLLKNIINGTNKAHANEKETLFLLYHIKAKDNKALKFEDCIEILQCFKGALQTRSRLKSEFFEKNLLFNHEVSVDLLSLIIECGDLINK